MEYYDGVQWKPIDAPPTISSISTDDATGDADVLTADGSTLYTVTITGGNFGIGATVKFIGNTGTNYTAGSINRVSNSSITCTTTAEMGTADDPYDVQVLNASGLAATLEDAFSFNAPPEFDNASGSLGTAYNTIEVTGSTLDASATDAEGDTITYSIASGSLPTGLSISSSTGLITGTPSGNTAGTFTFTVQASTAEGNATRVFSIDIEDLPTGGTITTSGSTRFHSFTSSSSLVVPTGFTRTAKYIIVGGGGSGGTGTSGLGANNNGAAGGGGGVQSSTSFSMTPDTYTIVIGAGGAGRPPQNNPGNPGVASSAFGVTAGAGQANSSLTGGASGSPQSNAGGAPGSFAGGGGGGAGGTGSGGGPNSKKSGGAGLENANFSLFGAAAQTAGNVTLTPTANGFFAGGGQGAGSEGSELRSSGGGGSATGGVTSTGTNAGFPNTGGGGAGGYAQNENSGNGGSGIVIISYVV
jgi:hypothetical protein